MNTGSTKEAFNEVGTATQPSEAIIKKVPNLGIAGWGSIFEMCFDVSMTILLGIEVRGIGREILLLDLRMFAQKRLGQTAGMNPRPVPDQNEALGKVPKQLLKKANHLRAFHATLAVPFVNLAG